LLANHGQGRARAPEWFQEVNNDGYRLRLERDGERVRLITKGGYDWTKRYPWIVEAALKNRQTHFVSTTRP
jgi:ATP-dependent DNA ligase